jgi:hypothetical protein
LVKLLVTALAFFPRELSGNPDTDPFGVEIYSSYST